MSTLTPTISLPGSPQRSPSSAPSDQFRVIAFGIDSYTFALPMGAIAKVIHCPPLHTPGLGRTGLIHLDQQVIRILDLHSYIASAPQNASPAVAPDSGTEAATVETNPLFLVVAHQGNGELCGIPVDTPPDLLELTRSQVRALPPSSRQEDTILALARFIAVIPTASTDPPASPSESTLLLLDLGQTMAQLHHRT